MSTGLTSTPNKTLLSTGGSQPVSLVQQREAFSLWGGEAVSAHAIVTGVQAQGKGELAASLLELTNADSPCPVWITDDGSLEDLAAQAQIEYHRLTLPLVQAARGAAPESVLSTGTPSICINPFWRPHDENGNVIPPNIDEQMDTARLLLLMLDSTGVEISGPANRVLMPLLYSAVTACFNVELEASSKEVTFSDFIRHLVGTNRDGLNGSDVAGLLHPYHGRGIYANLFDGQCSLPVNASVAIFGTQDLEGTPALAPAVLALQLRFGKRLRYELPRLKTKVFMLNHSFDRHLNRMYASTLAGLLRDYRRYGASCILITGQSDALERVRTATEPDEDLGLFENLSHHFQVVDTPEGTELHHSLLHKPQSCRAVPGAPTPVEMQEFEQKLKPLLSWASRFSDKPMAYLVETLNAKLPSSTPPAK